MANYPKVISRAAVREALCKSMGRPVPGGVIIEMAPDDGSDATDPWMLDQKSSEHLLHQLDLALHPWGEPGVVPDEPQDGQLLWVSVSGDDPERVIQYSDGSLEWAERGRRGDMEDDEIRRSRFRKRWTPEAP